jgi:hypothetical protein
VGAGKKAKPKQPGTSGRVPLLLVAWAILIGLAGGAVLYGHILGSPPAPDAPELVRLTLDPAPPAEGDSPAAVAGNGRRGETCRAAGIGTSCGSRPAATRRTRSCRTITGA